ncbi:MAG: insulinase family protein [Ruminococcaceae bacterium]|nr:insulinase family protein [Oscillospiraceae bacterium]
MIQTFHLLPEITLRCFSDNRFKQETLSLQFIRPMRKEEASLNALLPAVLLRGCETAADLRAITQRLDDLYGASVGAQLRRVGDYQTTGLSCSFMQEAYALDNDAVFAPMMAFLQELMFRPLLVGGVFSEEFVEGEKRNLLSAIAAQRNDKRIYANGQMVKRMCKGDSFGIPRLGEKEDVEAITPAGLYAHYQKVLRESPVHLFYVGATAPEKIAKLLRPMFAGLERNPVALPAQTPFHDCGGCTETEEMDVAQGKLCLGFVTPVTLRDKDFVAMQIFNTVFGGGMMSKLFMRIRETLSLCYDISSTYHGSKGIVTVSAGIDNHMDSAVQEEILAQLQACQAGDFTDDELTAAKQALLTQLQSTHDSPGAIEGYYATAALSGLTLSPADYIRAVEDTTAADVANAAKTLRLHTVYFLRGPVL